MLGARVLGEIGDDRTRFADAKALKDFAGTAPITRASGLKRSVTMRVIRNRRRSQGLPTQHQDPNLTPTAWAMFRRGHYELGMEIGPRHRPSVIFTELTHAGAGAAYTESRNCIRRKASNTRAPSSRRVCTRALAAGVTTYRVCGLVVVTAHSITLATASGGADRRVDL